MELLRRSYSRVNGESITVSHKCDDYYFAANREALYANRGALCALIGALCACTS